MPRYVTLFGIAPAAWAGLAPTPADRAAALRERLEGLGVRLVDLYQAFGGTYDGTAVYDAADDTVAATATDTIGAVGPGRACRTIRLRPGEHQRDALRRPPGPPAPSPEAPAPAAPRERGASRRPGRTP